MNVYDFDKTIYRGDSTIDFYLFCLAKQPVILLCLPKQIWGYFLYILGYYDKSQFKASFFSFLTRLQQQGNKSPASPVSDLVEEFWQANEHKIQPWFLAKHKKDDVVISASPEFLLWPICQRLGIKHLIASQVDPCTGQFTGQNCYGEEKVLRLKQAFSQDFSQDSSQNAIEDFYSDSLSDAPLAALAQHAFIVQGQQLIPWDSYQPNFMQRCRELFLDKSFILFILIGMINTFNGIVFAYLFSLVTYTNLAFILGYITSLTISYLLNSFITFKATLSWKKYLKFCLSYIPNFLMQNAMVMLFYNILGWPKLLTFALAALFGVPITFALMKLYAFKL